MSDPFHVKIHNALQDPLLQSALDNNADRRHKAFTAAFADLPVSRDVLRQRAHTVRADVIAHLDEYLAQFIHNAEANGMIVHRAATAAEATAIIIELAQKNRARLAAKSKSMVSEEVHLNTALEAAGIRPVETDLGEYIVQLRGEPPGHIITPAVHLNRAQVAQTFVEHLGVEYTEDVPTLTAVARKVLRQTFLDADVGLSGVNFGVAETGSLCMVTNEGNGRMCTTLPRLHIALMGIERLVATMDDLALMMYLLPRSSTGQKLGVYTSLIHGPRRPGEVDGPLERHLVLLDNGRSALRGSPLNDALLCVRCGACLNACPVFREIGGHAYRGVTGQPTPYSGPIGSVISPGLFGIAEYGNLARASSLCGACKEVCPMDIDLPKLLLRVRSLGAEGGQLPVSNGAAQPNSAPNPSLAPAGLRVGLRMFQWAARSPRRFAALQRTAATAVRLMPWMRGWVRLPALTGWGYSKDFPLPPGRPFRDRFAGLRPEPPTAAGGGEFTSAAHAATGAEAPPFPPAAPQTSPQARLERFIAELEALGGHAFQCNAANLPQMILAALNERNISALHAWDEQYLPDGLLTALQAAGIEIHFTPDPMLRLGLTGVTAAIAESGTLALHGGPGRPQTASLLVETHIAVLRSADILDTLPEALRLEALRHSSSAALISGPSRTADIEMTLTIGVHGPGEVLVFIL